jgi:hypothetical protein
MLSLFSSWTSGGAGTLVPVLTASLIASAAITGWMAVQLRYRSRPIADLETLHRLVDSARLELEKSVREGRPDPQLLARLRSLQALLPADDLRRL